MGGKRGKLSLNRAENEDNQRDSSTEFTLSAVEGLGMTIKRVEHDRYDQNSVFKGLYQKVRKERE
ncbi:hypothetical protein COS81_03090 [candidate division WWE3 bacterium CG06_land_8_20_14_3_00_42_16]|uniref:Uncharacterized protein n=4 Tax=Katanobacteria TaxID=422282 RepID=A0A2M7AMK6_UNCKA|nr:MAG: hypothetical protein COS81_03090 [candidate division WWE3 bacterium CG06_land_8_20_14_3_00_42_16]PIZ43009.1 MAG: hypothetical protein COY34_01785 [candidate division WWE3 bacterium CG_4_10_14_0_2_um_filter_42_8]PJA37979.1 MAG: hypothetical protein CO181_01400 [candidate division WWE3 bacterium CG_4_9_14_3_um_filter_43_9]PJC69357.1 MAG: hypothetical protein CO015_00540 [candidate division WWE3 bacterium CG_4_8_14_3_um_filter_42_11]